MGEKEAGAEKKNEVGAKKDETGAITVVFKVDMHCDGCAKKISKSVKKLQGVESVQADSTTNKLTVKGKVDPSKLRDNIEYKTKKKIQLISPQPAAKKEETKAGAAAPAPAPAASEDKKKPQAAADDKKKEPSPSTVVFKIRLHCDGCTQRIRKIINKFKGVQGVEIDTGKDLVMVKGLMDVKELQPYLKDKLRRGVDIVPPKKPDADGDGEKKAKDADGGDKKGKDGDGGDKKKEEGEKKKEGGGEVKKMEHHFAYENGYGYGHGPAPGYGYGYGQEHGYGNGYPGHLNGGYYGNPNANAQVHGYYGNGYGNAPAPQIFSDENPNACSVM